MDPLRMSASAMARSIRAGELRSVEAVEAHIAALERITSLGAVVARRYELAREEARAADAKHESVGAFHGVPITVKEAFAVTGMPHTSGLLARRGITAARDATAVARLRAAGAIVIALTNISELCMWLESDNRVYGRTNNPYDLTRIAGGSSGGEGAVVGAGASPVGLGADIGGSIRMPAFFCGVFGHKATGGLVPGTGHYPGPQNAARRYMTTGPIARFAEDLYPFLSVIAGADGEDEECRGVALRSPDSVRISELRIIDVPDNGITPVSAELREAQQRAARHLSSVAAEVRSVAIPRLRESLAMWSAMLAAATDTSFAELLGQGQAISVVRELVKLPFGRSPHTLPAIMLAAAEGIPLYRGRRGARWCDLAMVLRDEIEMLLGSDGVMLFPSYASVAPRHGAPVRWPFRWVYTGIMNVLELPATQVPLGLSREGLPLGVQVVGARGHDHLTIAVACELERAFGGWVPPAIP